MVQETGLPQRTPTPFSWSRTIMIFFFLMGIMVIIDPELSRGLGSATAAVLDPAFGFNGQFPIITIFLAAALTTGISTLIRHYFSDWVKLARVQKENSAMQKAIMEAYRRRNMHKIQKLNEKRREMSAKNIGIQFAPMKSMAFTFIMFILVYSWLNNMVNGAAYTAGTIWYAVPWQLQTSLQALYLFPSWILIYMLFNIFLGQLFSRILKFYSFKKKLGAMSETAVAG